jgi:hypothetical protein
LHLEQLPGYAPELSPAEGVWNYLKDVEGTKEVWRCEMVGVESTAMSRRTFLGAVALWGGREVLRRTPPGRLAESIPQSPRTESEMIDGLRTYGHQDPLNQAEVDQLVEELNMVLC